MCGTNSPNQVSVCYQHMTRCTSCHTVTNPLLSPSHRGNRRYAWCANQSIQRTLDCVCDAQLFRGWPWKVHPAIFRILRYAGVGNASLDSSSGHGSPLSSVAAAVWAVKAARTAAWHPIASEYRIWLAPLRRESQSSESARAFEVRVRERCSFAGGEAPSGLAVARSHDCQRQWQHIDTGPTDFFIEH